MLVRAIETLGTTMVEMRLSPDPRILAEVALVQLNNDEAGTDVDALLARIERLENTVKQLREEGAVGLAAVRSRRIRRPGGPCWAVPRAPTRRGAHRQRRRRSNSSPVAAKPSASVTVPEAWEQTVKGQVKPIVRALYSAGRSSVTTARRGSSASPTRPTAPSAKSTVLRSRSHCPRPSASR